MFRKNEIKKDEEFYIAGRFSETKISWLFLCPDIPILTGNIKLRAGKKVKIMPHIVPEVKRTDLLTYLRNYEPSELLKAVMMQESGGRGLDPKIWRQTMWGLSSVWRMVLFILLRETAAIKWLQILILLVAVWFTGMEFQCIK